MTNLLEVIAVLVVLIVALARPQTGRNAMRPVARRLRALAYHRRLAVVVVAATSLTINLLVGLFVKIPDPAIHDEFAYLLAADTFAHGRLANPTHPHAEFFQTYHVLQEPTYQCKYPPGQGLAMATGQVLCGLPIVGVWLSVACACGVLCWMLQGWMAPRWALLGGFLAAAGYGVITSWSQSYWGGGVAMAGGGLVFGAWPRLRKDPRVRHAVAFGVGLAILANSRPYEGLIASLPLAAMLASWCFGFGRPPVRSVLRLKVILPIAGVLLAAASWMAFYNLRVTGDPWQMPYQAWHRQVTGDPYLSQTLIGLGHPTEPGAASAVSLWDRCFSLKLHTSLIRKLLRQWLFYICPVLLPAVFLLPAAFGARGAKFFLLVSGLVLAAILLQGTAAHPHYAAPVAPLIFGLLVLGYRRLAVWRWQGRPSGRFLVFWLPAIYAAGTLAALAGEWSRQPYPPGHAWSLQRARVLRELEAREGRHLIFVRYAPRHLSHFEWVYNRADIDGAKVVWAHDLGAAANRSLIDYFSERQVWVLEADAPIPAPRPG